MGDLRTFHEARASENERYLYAISNDRRAENVSLSAELHLLTRRYESLERLLFGEGVPVAAVEGQGGLLDGIHGEAASLQSQLDAVTGVLAEITESTMGTDALIAKLTTTLGVSDVNFPFLRKLEAFFYPLLEGKTPPLDGMEIATKDYVDKALERIAGRLREHARDLLAKAAPKPSRLGSLIYALTGRTVTS